VTVNPLSVVVVGQGYVGLALAMRAVEVGHQVVGYDTDSERIKRLVAGESYVEDVSDAELVASLRSGRYLPTSNESDCEGFDVAVIAVPTPLSDRGPDLSFIKDAGRMLALFVRPGACVVLESTTYPGTTEELLAPILESTSGLRAGIDFHLGYSPERIDPGNSQWGFVNTPKVVSGINPSSLAVVQGFYDTLVDRTVPVSRTGEAELAKLIENIFRHVNIALMNELAMSANDLGFDIWEALDAASTKPFGFMRFEPGPGTGGHCLPIDPTYFSWLVNRRVGSPFRFIELANGINNHMPEYVVRRLILGLNRQGKPLSGSRILLLGVAYKADMSDTRESPAAAIAARLVDLGAHVMIADPHADDAFLSDRVARVELGAKEVALADAVVLLTAHASFDYEMVVSHASFVLDTRGQLMGEKVERL
jgi:UDP-N-acetyl-D-glucosamine dehydrogenase